MHTIKLNEIEYNLLKGIGSLILMREEEEQINKKIDINFHSVSKLTGVSYKTTKKYLRKLKDI